MSLADFWDNITDPDAIKDLITDIIDATVELSEDLADTCKNEGVEVLKATPAAIKELADITIPIIAPTPLNIAKSAHTLHKVIKEINDN